MRRIAAWGLIVFLSVLIPISSANRTVGANQAEARYRNRGQLRSAQVHFRNGMRLYDRGDYRRAVVEFKLAVNLYPSYWEAQYYLGDSYRLLGFYDLCLTHYDRVLVRSPGPVWFARVESKIGTVYEKRGSYRLAGLHYDRSLKAKPGFGPAQKAKFRVVKYKGGKDWGGRDRGREKRDRY